MRIVAHNGARIWGGAERATVELLRGLAARGHEVTLLCNDDLVRAEAERCGIRAELCPIGGDVAVHHALRVRSALLRLAPDAFIIGTYKKLFIASLGARLARVPRIVARVGLETDTPRSAKYRFALRKWVDGVAVNASRMLQPFAILEGLGKEKVALIHNGVVRRDPDRSSPSLRDELGIPKQAFVVGSISRLAKQKRIDRLLEAIALSEENVRCIVTGDGEERESLVAIAARLNLSDRVDFIGHQEDTGRVLSSLDAFVLSSDREGLSNSMLGAMSAGVPVITTPVSGAEDAIGGNPPAGIITGFDASGIAAAIGTLQRNPGLRSEMGSAARSRAATVFSMERMLDKWEEFLAA